MKKVVLILTALLAVQFAQSQCTPNIIYTDSIFGVWPDTTTNFPSVEVNDMYLTQLDLLVPNSTADLPDLPIPISAPIDSGAVISVSGLPVGIDYECSSHTVTPCTYLPDTLGCAILTGTAPPDAGTYDIEITVRAYLFFIGQTIEQDITFSGYRVVVTDSTIVGLSENVSAIATVSQNIPNPFHSETRIDFLLNSPSEVTFTVIDLLGEEVHRETLNCGVGKNSIDFEADGLNEGIYLYTITSGTSNVTKRMVIRQ